MSFGDFRLDLDNVAIDHLAFTDEAEDLAQDAGDIVAERSADFAPKASGEGAESIHAETDIDGDGYYADVSWDRDHFYMGFHELGTEHEPATPFLRPGLDSSSI